MYCSCKDLCFCHRAYNAVGFAESWLCFVLVQWEVPRDFDWEVPHDFDWEVPCDFDWEVPVILTGRSPVILTWVLQQTSKLKQLRVLQWGATSSIALCLGRPQNMWGRQVV